jgi:hypothetical protein
MITRIYIFLIVFLGSSIWVIAQDCYESSIVSPSPFMGNNKEIFKLADGSIWEVKYEYEYLYEYYPSIIICPNKGILIIGDKRLNVELVSVAQSSKNKKTNEWEVFEETNIKGTIRGTVKKGNIFKTTSGAIYEVTGITIQVVVEVQPNAMVLKRGDTYKLIIEGFDEPLICKCLNCSSSKSKPAPTKKNEIKDFAELVNYLRNSKIIAQDSENTYLGKLSNKFDSESIFNEIGKYGNEFSLNSILNEFSRFGNEFNSYSPFNEFSSTPPMIIKNGKIIAYLTTNDLIDGAVSPKILLALKDQF